MSGSSLPTLHTARLELRPLRRDDVDGLTRVFADPEMTRWRFAPLSTRESIVELIEKRLGTVQPAGIGSWVLVLDGETVGIGHLRRSVELPPQCIEIGWNVAKPHWGVGLAGEAAGAIIEHALGPLGLPAVWALIHPENTGSLRLAAKLGFLKVGAGHHYGTQHEVHVAMAPPRPPTP